MKVDTIQYRTIWPDPRCKFVEVIDQTRLPHEFVLQKVATLEQMVAAIKTMQVRGAPLIGAAAAYGMAIAMVEDDSDAYISYAADLLLASRPTAVNLRWAIERMRKCLLAEPGIRRTIMAWSEAAAICEEDVAINRAIGQHGLRLIQEIASKKTGAINILTHCNAGWLATVDWGTALAPVYAAHDAGIAVHVWVDETRPRNQGASLTAWELGHHGVPYTVITDNAGGHLMQHGEVDIVIVGADRVTASGDVCNKIGTYLKALAAKDNAIPFYAAVPGPTIDWTISDGLSEIHIEERDAGEVAWVHGRLDDGSVARVSVVPEGAKVSNPAFDVTPARYVTGIITESGVFAPERLKDSQG